MLLLKDLPTNPQSYEVLLYLILCVCVWESVSVCVLACSFDYITYAIITEAIQYIKKLMNH